MISATNPTASVPVILRDDIFLNDDTDIALELIAAALACGGAPPLLQHSCCGYGYLSCGGSRFVSRYHDCLVAGVTVVFCTANWHACILLCWLRCYYRATCYCDYLQDDANP